MAKDTIISLSRRGITQIELLIVVLVFACFAALLVMQTSVSHTPGHRNTCANNQKQLVLALLSYETVNRKFPGSWMSFAAHSGADEQTVNWVVPLLPFLERNDLYRAFWEDPAIFGNPPRGLYQSILFCPSIERPSLESERARLHYIVNCGRPDNASSDASVPLDYRENGVFFNQTNYGGQTSVTGSSPGTAYPPVEQTLAFIQGGDGTAHTLLLSETVEPIYWYDATQHPPIPQEGSPAVPGGANEFLWGMLWFGGDDPRSVWDSATHAPQVGLNSDRGGSIGKAGHGLEAYARPSSNHTAGFNVIFCDGHYGFLAQGVDYRVYCQLMTPRGNESRNPGTDELTFRGYPDAGKGAWLRSADPPELIPLRDEEY